MRQLTSFSSLALLVAACNGSASALDGSAQGLSVSQPGAPATDRGDSSCSVVLREVARLPDASGNGYRESCSPDGSCSWVWQGQIDLSRDAFPQPPDVRVIYRLASAGDPSEATAWITESAVAGFWRATFELSQGLLGPGASAQVLAEERLELWPYVLLADGSRLFDQNRLGPQATASNRPGRLAPYSVGQAEQFAVREDGSCAPVAATLGFLSGWQRTQDAPIRAGGWVRVLYALDRLPQCRGTHNGFPAWDIQATLRFSPGGQIVSGTVRTFAATEGVPTNVAETAPLDVAVPLDARAVEIWFHNFSGAGNGCEAWDSDFGQNYRFPVLPPAGSAG
jgi:hypothetical protein